MTGIAQRIAQPRRPRTRRVHLPQRRHHRYARLPCTAMFEAQQRDHAHPRRQISGGATRPVPAACRHRVVAAPHPTTLYTRPICRTTAA
eukprot:2442487-Prymnesium_polylepis.1